MTRITIKNPITCVNPFVENVSDALAMGVDPYPSVYYDYDGNEVEIDGEYYTLESDVQAYLEDIDRQIDEVPIRQVYVETRTIEIVEAYERDENQGVSPSDDRYETNGLIRFAPDA